MSDAPTRSATAGESAPPRADAVVAVLAFGGIVVSLMQTPVIPIVGRLPAFLNASAPDTAGAAGVPAARAGGLSGGSGRR
ncbi:hypothetical protein SAMN05216505_104151 [Streptomyces prasinopilosus]|uniref:Uncharacterized protein n=1 Tax=Streptomyces prasinopilosus TaxID=67344 RepID=A0A1G6QKJ4_9ACTN|nr:hypothetical protein SAMN05216505_104151 [Streptomyces prasinopilosus]